MKKLGLADLICPLAIDALMTRYWQRKLYVGHGLLDAARETVATARVVEILDEFIEGGLILRNGGI